MIIIFLISRDFILEKIPFLWRKFKLELGVFSKDRKSKEIYMNYNKFIWNHRLEKAEQILFLFLLINIK